MSLSYKEDFSLSIQRTLYLKYFKDLKNSIEEIYRKFKKINSFYLIQLKKLENSTTNQNQKSKSFLFPLFKEIAEIYLELSNLQHDIICKLNFFKIIRSKFNKTSQKKNIIKLHYQISH